MPLTLTLQGAHRISGPASHTLTEGNLSIGRAPDNGWVLPDPDRLLSKTHCFVTAQGGQYFLTDVSTNGVFVNGSPHRVPRNGQVALTDGDEFRIGDYVFSVSETMSAAAAAPRGGGFAPDTAVDFGGRPDPLDMFDTPSDLGGGGFTHPLSVPPQPAWRTNDPFDAADAAHPAAPGSFADDLLRPDPAADPWAALPAQPDNADAPAHAFTAPRVTAPVNFDDFDDLLGDAPPPSPAAAAPPAAAPPAATHAAAPEVSAPAAFAPPPDPPPPAQPPPAPPPAPPPVSPSGPPGADAARALAAFLEGAGVAAPPAGTDPEAALRAAGEVFRAMVEGVRQVLISRAAIKNELRVEQTMLRARDNNALKFSVTAEDAVAALLTPNRPGYKPPLAATREAFADIAAHEMAVMAGVQTALMALLKRFEPETLERRLSHAGLLGSVLPAARKARMWEVFCAAHGEIVREAEDDFQSVFGREFARAYDAQMHKL